MIKAWCLEEICWIFSLSLSIHETILYKFLPRRLASVWDPLVYFCQHIDRNWHSFVDILCNQKWIKLHSGLQQEKRQYDTAPLVAIQAALFRQQRTQKTLSPSSLSVCSGWFYKMFHWLPSMSEYITFLSESLTQFCGKHGCEHKGLYMWPRFFICLTFSCCLGGDTHSSAFCVCPELKFKTIFLFRTTDCAQFHFLFHSISCHFSF